MRLDRFIIGNTVPHYGPPSRFAPDLRIQPALDAEGNEVVVVAAVAFEAGSENFVFLMTEHTQARLFQQIAANISPDQRRQLLAGISDLEIATTLTEAARRAGPAPGETNGHAG